MKAVYRLWYRSVLLLMAALALVGVLILARIILLFFGELKSTPGYETIVNLTNPFVASLQTIERVKTPYAGEFDLPATITLLLIVVLESFLGVFRGILGRRSSG